MFASPLVDRLRKSAPLVAPSLLACDFARIELEIRRLEAGGAGILHLDIMDGHFVPNISFGVPVVKAIRHATDLPLDVHLMISNPAQYVKPFREAGADLLTIHIETVPQPEKLLEQIHALGAAAGLSLNPPTPVTAVEPYVDQCELVLVMSVMPGFGGQTFQPEVLSKVQELRNLSADRLLVSIDGGVNLQTVSDCAAAGAHLLVTGSALFSQNDYGRFIAEMTRRAGNQQAV